MLTLILSFVRNWARRFANTRSAAPIGEESLKQLSDLLRYKPFWLALIAIVGKALSIYFPGFPVELADMILGLLALVAVFFCVDDVAKSINRSQQGITADDDPKGIL